MNVKIEVEKYEGDGEHVCLNKTGRCPFLYTRRFGSVYMCGAVHDEVDGTGKWVTPHDKCPLRGLAPMIEGVSVDKMAEILRDGYRAMIVEADEWRPMARHVLALMARGGR